MEIGQAIIITVSAIAGLAGFILTIWALLEKINKKFAETLDTKIEAILIRNNAIQEKEIKLMIENISTETVLRLETLKDELLSHIKQQEEINKKQEEHIETQRVAILEKFKRDIRDVYYKLRVTGEILDKDKAYVDKIYRYYQDLGGNSDIYAKMKEINEVYAKQTLDAYEGRQNK